MGLAVFSWKLKVQDSFFVNVVIVKFVFVIDFVQLNPSTVQKTTLLIIVTGIFSVKGMTFSRKDGFFVFVDIRVSKVLLQDHLSFCCAVVTEPALFQ